MSKFKREARYIVVKLSDMEIAGLSPSEIESFNRVCDRVALARVAMGKPLLQCVVVEKDWPEYEPTWDAIESRMTGEPREFVLMPSRLTAENGAEAALSGEFHERQRVTCCECLGEGCGDCNDYGYNIIRVPVSWRTTKQIYAKAVSVLAR